MLIIFGGLPGSGKTTVARYLAQAIKGLHLRIDTIEQALKKSNLAPIPMNDVGYCIAQAIAEDNLRLGISVIADAVNPVQQSRDSWNAVAMNAQQPALNIEIVCSDKAEHRRRVETRIADIADQLLPTWQEVCNMEYQVWQQDRLLIDTAQQSVSDIIVVIRAEIDKFSAS